MIVNLFQLVMLTIALTIGIMRTISTKKRKWLLVSMFFFSYALGDLYWVLMIFFYGHIPRVGHISEISWYTSYLFLLLLMDQVKLEAGYKNKLLYLAPVFTGVSCIYFMQWGEYLDNIICAGCMTGVIWLALKGRMQLKETKKNLSSSWLFRAAMVFATLEYAEWYASCIWDAEDFSNPYYTIDILLTICMVLFLPAVRKISNSEIKSSSDKKE